MTDIFHPSRIVVVRDRTLRLGIMVLFSGAFYPYILASIGDINQNENSLRLQILFSLVYLSCLLIAFSDYLNNRDIEYARHKLSIFFAAFLVLSSAWSFDPVVTFRNGVAYFGTILLAIILRAKSRDLNHLLIDLLRALRIGAVSSITLVLFSPNYRGEGGQGFAGVYVHKNSFGAAMSLGILLSLYFMICRKSRFSIMWFTLFLVALYLSNSSTAQMTAVIGSLFVFLTTTLQRSMTRNRLVIISTFVLLVIMMFLILLAKNITINNVTLTTTGKDATFTGRTKIWEVAINALSGDQFLLGYGYNSFWFSPKSRSLNQYLVGFKNYNTHNGFLEIMLSVGVIGLLLFLVILFKNVIESMKNENFVIVLPLTIWFLVSNLTESLFIIQNSLLPMLLVFLKPDKKGGIKISE